MPTSKAAKAERIAAGICTINPAHGRARIGRQLCAACAVRQDGWALRAKRARRGTAQAQTTNRDFFEALQDLWYAGKIGMGR